MRLFRFFTSLVPAFAIAAGLAAQQPAAIRLDSLHWTGRPGGVQMANVEGDPMVPDKPYSVALKIGTGVWIAPHWHPNDQHFVVLQGTLRLGRGAANDTASAAALGVGALGIIPGHAVHFEGNNGGVIVLLYGVGPMTTTFVSKSLPR